VPRLFKLFFYPSADEKLAWYDRAVRIIGGIAILGLFFSGFVFLLLDLIK
jgi:hypothetical protein